MGIPFRLGFPVFPQIIQGEKSPLDFTSKAGNSPVVPQLFC